MKIIFARHGQTVFGAENRFEGLSDSPLTSKGNKQARNLAEFCVKENIKKIYSSPLGRAQRTSDEISKKCGLEVVLLEKLKETCYGDWEGKGKSDLDQGILSVRKEDLFKFVAPGNYEGIKGESHEQLFKRLELFFDELKKEKETIIIVSHLGVMRCARKYFENINNADFNKLEIPNNCVYIVENNKGKVFTSSRLL